MKRLLATAFLALSFSAPVLAADLPIAAPAPAPYLALPPAFTWTGFYAGINGGYGWGTNSGSAVDINPAGVVSGTGTAAPVGSVESPDGALLGGTLGYNYQFGTWLAGFETDLQYSHLKGTGSAADPCCAPTFTGAAGIFSATQNLSWFGTVRGRLGFLATPDLLLYGTGGLIYGHESVAAVLTFPPAPFFGYPSTASSTRAGWTAGGGVEYMFLKNWSARVEGLYYDMGHMNSAFTCPAAGTSCTPGYTNSASYSLRGGIVRAALIWHFASY